MHFFRPVPRVSVLLLLTGLTACATTQLQPGAHEARLQNLEADVQRLATRLDAMQDMPRQARNGWRVVDARFDSLPAEAMPVTPTIKLLSGSVRPAPTPTVVPVPMRKVVPPTVPATPRRRPDQGDWVINLASYNRESFAAAKLAEFVEKGVPVEQAQASVKGRTVYRLRVPGFESYRAANTEASSIRTILSLKDTWIARR